MAFYIAVNTQLLPAYVDDLMSGVFSPLFLLFIVIFRSGSCAF